MAKRAYPLGSSSSATTKPGVNDFDLTRFLTTHLTEGVIKNVGSDFAVSEKGAGANMSVDVAAGIAIVEITNTNLTHGRTYKTWFENTTTVNVAVTTADATYERIDRLVLRIDVSIDPDGNASDVAVIELLAGTPAGSPSAPATPSNAISLATVSVPAGDTTISDAQITDTRTYCDLLDDVLANVARADLLASVANGEGASLIGIEDSGNKFTSTTVEDALVEVITLSGLSTIQLLPENGNPSSNFPCSSIQTIAPSTTIAYDTINKGSSASAASHTISHTCSGDNRMLFVSVATLLSTDTVTGVTYNGVAMTRVGAAVNFQSTNRSIFLYALANPASGANDVVVTLSGATTLYYNFVSYSGCSATQPTTGVSLDTTGTSLTATPTNLNDDSWIFITGMNDVGNYAGGTDTTLRGSASGHDCGDTNGAGAYSAILTSASANHGGIGIPLLPFGVYPQMRVFDFDKAAFESAEFKAIFPTNYDGGTVTAKIHWRSTAASGDVVWKIRAVAIDDNEASDSAYGAAQSVTDTSTGANQVNISPATSAITVGGSPDVGKTVWFQVSRDATNASDTLDADARLIAIEITYNG